MNILFLGDIVGKMGRRVVRQLLPEIKKEHGIDLVIANGENLAHGKGFTPKTVEEMMKAGIDIFTGGNHSFYADDFLDAYSKNTYPVIRPLNYSHNAPGIGWMKKNVNGTSVMIINLIGKVFMSPWYLDPFHTINELLLSETADIIIVDFHTETTAEKYIMRYHLNGKITLLVGTHTHVPTADAHITEKNMGYITDIGMCGSIDSSIGVNPEGILAQFQTGLPHKHELSVSEPLYLRAVYASIEQSSCRHIELIQRKYIP